MKKLLMLLALLFIPVTVNGYTLDKEDYVYASGQSIGIKLNTNVVISGLYPVKDGNNEYKPWKNVLKEGDIILEINHQKINNSEDIKTIISAGFEKYEIKISRNKKVMDLIISPATKSDGTISLGIYVKDHVLGVGTMTYVIPGENIYGALGHSINSNSSFGEVYDSEVIDIKKSSNGNVGEKQVKIEYNPIGDVKKNTLTGIHGILKNNVDLPLYQIGLKDSVHKGKAYILTSIDGKNIEKFDIEIIDVIKQSEKAIKSMKVKITDDKLIEKCGGIIQGMSGSPIIQDERLVGALTHVVINNTKLGYGIYIEWMMDDMGIDIK